jgi:hypothetical protein
MSASFTADLQSVRSAFQSAYVTHKSDDGESARHGAFRMLTREGVRLTTPRHGLGVARRLSRLERAHGLVVGLIAMTENSDAVGVLDDAQTNLANLIAITKTEAEAKESESAPVSLVKAPQV